MQCHRDDNSSHEHLGPSQGRKKRREAYLNGGGEITIRIFSSCCIANLATRERERLVFNAEQIGDMIYLIQAWQ